MGGWIAAKERRGASRHGLADAPESRAKCPSVSRQTCNAVRGHRPPHPAPRRQNCARPTKSPATGF